MNFEYKLSLAPFSKDDSVSEAKALYLQAT
jgi:hypothetical protein